MDPERDLITGAPLPDCEDEPIRQTAERLLLELGYAPDDIQVEATRQEQAHEGCLEGRADLLILSAGRPALLMRCVRGSLLSRERESVAATRLIADPWAPLVLVYNGADAELIDVASGKVTATGLAALPGPAALAAMVAAFFPPQPRPGRGHQDRSDLLRLLIHTMPEPLHELSTALPKSSPIIEVEGLTAGYGDQVILKNVSFSVAQGEIMVVLGGSGCGKSTLLKHIIGLHPPAAGKVVIDGVEVNTAQDEKLERLRRGIGVLFQSGALFGSLNLLENVALPLLDFTDLPRELALMVARAKLAMMGLAGYENHLPSEISGGMKKRAGLARAMAMDPKVLFFDEPSAGLDPVASAELDQLILSINAGLGTTMVIVTHELASIYAIAHRVLMLDKSAKGVIAQGTPRELRDHSDDSRVRAFFLRQPRGH